MVNFSGRYGLLESNLHAYNGDSKLKIPKMGMSIGWKFYPQHKQKMLNFRPKKLFAYVEIVCKEYNNKKITLKK